MDKVRFKEYFLAHSNDLLKLLSIPSVYDEQTADEDHPYGKAVFEALQFMEELLRREGFSPVMIGKEVVYGSIGQGERIDIASHLDVVNVGKGWSRDPFDAYMDEDILFGRGSQDMKTSGYLVYLAAKMLKEEGYTFNKEIRLVYGSDEERMMGDLKLYVRQEGLPAFAFTPDGTFPIAYGEKGALMWTIRVKTPEFVKELDCGLKPNIIAPIAKITLHKDNIEEVQNYIDTHHLDADVTLSDLLHIEVRGISSHASRPEEGRSAIIDLCTLIRDIYHEEIFTELADCFSDLYGSGSENAYDIEPMGRLTMSPGILKIEGDEIIAHIDSRYPYGVTSQTLTEHLQKHLPSFDVKLPYDDPPTLTSLDDPYVQALMAAYKEATQDDTPAFISGGVSYSKVYGHCVSFGPLMPDDENLCHKDDESIKVSTCITALEIYYTAIKKLLEVDA